MRLDKLFSDMGLLSRKACAQAVRRAQITVDGKAVRSASVHVDPAVQVIAYGGERVVYETFTYVLLNKPAGYVSATDDPLLPYVTELLPEVLRRRELFPAGRLDRDTVGLMLLTNDGRLAHDLLSPRHHVEKVYRFTCERALDPSCEERFLSGITIGDYACKSAVLVADADRMGGELTLTEGKYHQVKRMLEAVDNRVSSLERIRFGPLTLDPTLPRGAWRYLTDAEREAITAYRRGT